MLGKRLVSILATKSGFTRQLRDLHDVRDLLRNHALQADQGWNFYRCRNQCPLSTGYGSNESSMESSLNAHQQSTTKFYIEKQTGRFVCLHCHRHGSRGDLELALAQKLKSCRRTQIKLSDSPLLCKYKTGEDQSSEFSDLSRSTLCKYGAKVCRMKDDSAERVFVFPIFGADRSTIIDAVTFTSMQTSYPMFGLQTLNPRHTEVIVTSCVEDALNAYEAIGQSKPCLALLFFPIYFEFYDFILAMFDQFKKVYLWPSDEKTSEKLFQLASLLNPQRCFLMSSLQPPKQIRQQAGQSVKPLFQDAYPIINEEIQKFSYFQDAVRSELTSQEQYSGARWQRYPLLNQILKGHRLGELTVLTGSTGCGKTTFLSDYSLDLCVNSIQTRSLEHFKFRG
ncbi:hypothetical protein ACOME3_003572 [Neoechinorhynchus agilis]